MVGKRVVKNRNMEDANERQTGRFSKNLSRRLKEGISENEARPLGVEMTVDG